MDRSKKLPPTRNTSWAEATTLSICKYPSCDSGKRISIEYL